VARVLLTVVLPLLLPTILYVLWATSTRRRSRIGLRHSWPWLALAGVALCAGVLVAAWLRTGTGGNGTYVPPHVVDGKVVPGELVPPRAPTR
jgi:hypothetical protein